MSSFFRKPDEVTVSEDYTGAETTIEDSEDASEDGLGVGRLQKTRTSSSTQSISREEPPGTVVGFPSAPRLTTGHRMNSQEILTRAALERSFIYEALAELLQTGTNGPYTTDHPEVQALAQAKYQQVTDLLHQGGLLKTESKQESDLRPAFRKGLDLLANNATPNRALPESVATSEVAQIELFRPPQRSASFDISETNLLRINQMMEQATRFTSSLPGAVWEHIGHPMFRTSRYEDTFVQMELLGKGGFGKVYRVQHKLSQTDYAVKKIPVSAVRLRKIQERGKQELDSLFKEVRALSRLDHPNIVRFYDGWLEYSAGVMEATAGLSDRIRDVILEEDPAFVAGFRKNSYPVISSGTASARQGAGVTVVDEPHLTIGETTNETTTESEEISRFVGSRSHEFQDQGSIVASQEIDFAARQASSDQEPPHNALQPVRGSAFPPQPAVSHTAPRSSRPELILHIQMGLHPMSLADYLLPPSLEASTANICHCFHTKHSLAILLELLDGVNYMHAKGIAHGDLKPSNIFLSIDDDQGDSKAPLLKRCGECENSPHCAGSMGVRIGDFGLAAEIAKPEGLWTGSTQASKAVGTALYRPVDPTHDGAEGLDVYALGIIAAELLAPFQTKMERHERLNAIKKGKVDQEIEGKLADTNSSFADLLRRMVACDAVERPSCQEVRECIRSLLS